VRHPRQRRRRNRPYRQPICKFLPRHPRTFISVARPLLLFLPPSTRQEDNDWLRAELRDGHTKFRTLSYRGMGLEAAALPNSSQHFFGFMGKKL
jgi:hypothetical protein